MQKKANLGLIAIVIVLGLVILTITLINFYNRECSKNSDCSQSAYCGSDYKCHEFPKEIIVKENSYILASTILGVAMIIAAYILKGGRLPFRKKD